MEYNFLRYKNYKDNKDIFLMTCYIKLDKNISINNFTFNYNFTFREKNIINYIEKLISLKYFFTNSSLKDINSKFFLYNNNICYFDFFNLCKIKDLIYDENKIINSYNINYFIFIVN